MPRRLPWSWSGVVAVALIAGCATAGPSGTTSIAAPTVGRPTSSPTATSTPLERPSASLTVEQARRADLAFLKDKLVAIHPNPFLDEGESAFDARVAAIEQRVATLSDVGFLV